MKEIHVIICVCAFVMIQLIKFNIKSYYVKLLRKFTLGYKRSFPSINRTKYCKRNVNGLIYKDVILSWNVIILLIIYCFNTLSAIDHKNTNIRSIRSINGSKTYDGMSHLVNPGEVIHLFPRYGYLSLSMRVVPRNDSHNWIFLEPTKNIFIKSTLKYEDKSIINENDKGLPLHNEFHIDLCEDISQLVQAYFRRFIVEGLERPWHAYAGGWRSPSLAKYFGIDPIFVKGNYRYMLVRVLNIKKTGKAIPFQNVTIQSSFIKHLNAFRMNDYTTAFNVFNNVGTHYIHSFTTGNAVYQVFVYEEGGYEAVKRRLSENGWIRSSYMNQLPYLLPLWVKHMGKVMVLNGSPETIANIRQALNIRFLFSSYSNIFKMHDNASLVRKIEKYLKMEYDALLGLELKSLAIVFHDSELKKWFTEALTQTIHLWEINL